MHIVLNFLSISDREDQLAPLKSTVLRIQMSCCPRHSFLGDGLLMKIWNPEKYILRYIFCILDQNRRLYACL